MGTTVAIGSDGSATFPNGFKASLNTWSATLTRTTSVVTGFGDTGHRRVASAVLDITGSAGGVPFYNNTNTSPLGIDTSSAMTSLALFWNAGAGDTAECSITFDAVCSSVALASTQDADATVTFNFEVAETSNPAFVWYEV